MPASRNENSQRTRNRIYWICLLTRNGAGTIGKTLDSIRAQTLPPVRVVVVDDGSTDDTHTILERQRSILSIPLDVITLPDKGYDIHRVEANINLAYSYAQKKKTRFSFFMISADDCFYPKDYCESIMKKMGLERHLAVASGDWTPPISGYVKAPHGTGRVIRRSFWEKVGGYPVAYGSESWLLSKAQQLGYQIANFQEIRFTHMRPSGTAHKFKHWGIAMRALGFHPLAVLLRFVSAVRLRQPISFVNWLTIFAEYFLPVAYHNDPYWRYDNTLRHFVRDKQLETFLTVPRIRPFRGFVRALWRTLEQVFCWYY